MYSKAYLHSCSKLELRRLCTCMGITMTYTFRMSKKQIIKLIVWKTRNNAMAPVVAPHPQLWRNPT